MVCPGLLGAWTVRNDGGLPRAVQLPWHWQANAEANPPGLAAVVATGALSGLQTDTSSQFLVVGRNGSYRSLYPAGAPLHAGGDVHLSPDGRYLAMPYLHRYELAGLSITDLTTGHSRTVDLPRHDRTAVLGWRPDGSSLLVGLVTGDTVRIALIEITDGMITTLATASGAADLRRWRFAFSPDSERVAMAIGGELRLVDGHGTTMWTVALAPGRTLAGGGAFTPDGQRVALVHSEPCEGPCSVAPPWIVTYVDSADGTATHGPLLPRIIAAEIRAIGWSGPTPASPGGLVVVRYLPADSAIGAARSEQAGSETIGPADLYELAPGAPARLVLDAPYEVTDIDVAADLVGAGRFGDSPSVPSLLPIETGRVRLGDVGIGLSVLGGLAAVVAVFFGLASRARPRRRRR
jgi:hypothetical protein